MGINNVYTAAAIINTVHVSGSVDVVLIQVGNVLYMYMYVMYMYMQSLLYEISLLFLLIGIWNAYC